MRKINYVKTIRNVILVLSMLLIIVCISFSVSYSNFIYKSSDHRAVEMYVGKLKYSILINNIETSTFTIAPGNSVLDIEIESLNGIDTYFKLLYLKNPSLKISYINESPSGKLKVNESKTYKLFVNNSSSENITGSLIVSGGYINNDLDDIEISSEYNEIKESIAIGDYINYMPNGINDISKYNVSKDYSGFSTNQDTYLKSTAFRILNIRDDGTIDIISSESIAIDLENSKLKFNGYLGYNNGVNLLNSISNNLYGSSKYALSARNINISDIEKYMNLEEWDYNNYINPIVSTGLYGGSKRYNNIYYPSISSDLNQNDNGELTILKKRVISITIKQDYWSNELKSNNFIDTLYYDLFMNSGNYWLSSRYANALENSVSWGLYSINNNSVVGANLCNSNDEEYVNENYIRPVIRLTANIKLNKVDNIFNITEN